MSLSKDEINYKEFVKIPDYNYEINRNGKIRNIETGHILDYPNSISCGYYCVCLSKNGKAKTFYVHQLLANAFIPKIKGKKIIDHKDRDKLNNNIENLHWVNHSQNSQNKNKRENTTSLYYGVCWHKKAKKWQASIRINNKSYHIGLFEDEKDAAFNYDINAIRVHGKDAKINFINWNEN